MFFPLLHQVLLNESFCIHHTLSVLLTVSVRLSGDAPKAETAGLRRDQDALVSQFSVAGSMLQEQQAVHRGRHSGQSKQVTTTNTFIH